MFPNVVNFAAFRSELDALVGDSYTIKDLNSGDCAVQCNSPDSYRLVARHFLDKGSLFHHHQLPEDRPYKIVMRNIHHGVPSSQPSKTKDITFYGFIPLATRQPLYLLI